MKLVGERRAVACAILALYGFFYAVLALLGMVPNLGPALAALAGVYGLAFFALVAGYFWARWYAVGVGLYGVITSAVGIWQLGPEPILLFVGGTHLVATLALWGDAVAGSYDGQSGWRARFHMDDGAVQRLGRAVIRAGVSLPFILLYALAPATGSSTHMAMTIGAVVLGTIGLRGLVQLKTWGVLALGAAGALMTTVVGANVIAHGAAGLQVRPAIAGVMLLTAVVPFIAPMARWVARPAR
jgi:hypothetical protein